MNGNRLKSRRFAIQISDRIGRFSGKMALDLTIAVCAHNAAARLTRPLAAIAAMNVPKEIAWECLVVDNASTDGTASVANDLAAKLGLALRVVAEPKIGLIHARTSAAREAAGEILSFVDDDNLVAADWATQCVEFFHAHPNAGIAGGKVDAVFEDPTSAPPDFQQRDADALAVRDLGDLPKRLTPPENDPPCGAGMTGRTEVFRKVLLEIGCFLTGRNGEVLTSGEDTEIGLIAQKLGWETWYAPTLKMGHILPPQRLRQEYLDQLVAAGARSSPWLDYLRGKDARRSRFGLWLAAAECDMIATKMKWASLFKGNNHPDAARFPFWIEFHRNRAAGLRDLAARGYELQK